MTKTVNRKPAKRGRTEGGENIKQPAKKSSKKPLQNQQETSRRWKIGLIILLCLLIGAVVVFFNPFSQTALKEKVSQGNNVDQSKKAKKSKDKRSDGQKGKSAGKICVQNLP